MKRDDFCLASKSVKHKSFPYLSRFFLCSLLVFIFLLTFVSGCRYSVVYSPSVNLPPGPLEQWDVQILGGVGMFPEVRPHEKNRETAVGGETTIRLALSDRWTLQAKGWTDLSGRYIFNRSGFSVSSLIVLNKEKSLYRFGIMPTCAFLYLGKNHEGFGCALPLCLWFPEFMKNNIYIALGPGLSATEWPIEDREWGWGVLLNVGTSILIEENFTLNFEVSSILQRNEYESVTDFILSPSFNIGLLF